MTHRVPTRRRSAIALVTALLLVAAGFTQSPATAATEQHFFPRGAEPRRPAVADRSAAELGMRFQVARPGRVVGVRFYDTRRNRGPQEGRLWSANGRRLATATFGRRAGSGWRSVTFARPVRVVPGRTYVVSYLAPHGRYAADGNSFRSRARRGDVIVPARAGAFRHGRGFPQGRRTVNYYVDVRFVPRSTAAPTAGLDLPRLPWYGGPAYYARFPKARAAGWTSAAHFPIGVFFGKPDHARALAGLGINTFMGAEHDGSPISRITRQGISVLAQDEWRPSEVGSNARVVGWHVSDECDMGGGDCASDQGEYGSLAIQRQKVAALRAYNDGRFMQANFGNGVLDTFWSPNTMDDHVRLMDVTSVDKYAYTSPVVQDNLRSSPHWPSNKNPASAGAYGWQQDRMETFASPRASKPNWVFVETAQPFLTEPGARTIGLDQIGGAVWNAIIHGAAGITYFQHNNNGQCGTYSLIDCSQALKNRVRAIDAQVRSLAPVINTPSYAWSFGPGLETALKARRGSIYVLAMTSGGTGSRTFTLPPGTTGSVEVVGEGRRIAVSGGRFTDSFPAESTHHVYRIALDSTP